MDKINYKKYKWFFTSGKKLVIGGKSAEQNDSLIEEMKKTKKEYFVMHTSHPGSPFSFIVEDVNEVTKKDLQECAVFTGCFSRAWKDAKKKTEIHVFKLSQLSKKSGMKAGTWQVSGTIKNMEIELKLAFTKQEGVYRAIPFESANKEEIIFILRPGKIDKNIIANKIIEILKESKNKKEEIIIALPAGGIEILGN